MRPIHRDPVKLPLDLAFGLREKPSTPGPGFYSLTTRQSPGGRFSKSPRARSLFPSIPEETPGCIYSQETMHIRRTVSASQFSRSPRDSINRRDRGGNFLSDPISTLSRRAHSFAASRAAYRSVYFPGSDRERLGRTSRSISMTSRGSIAPRNSGRSFPRSPRSTITARSSSLGPGHYNPSIPPKHGTAVPFGSPRQASRLNFPLFEKLSRAYWSM